MYEGELEYRLYTNSAMSKKRMMPSVPLPEGRHNISPITNQDDISYLAKCEIDLELDKILSMTPEEAAAAAARAVAEAASAVAEADSAVAEVAEAMKGVEEAEAVALELTALEAALETKNGGDETIGEAYQPK